MSGRTLNDIVEAIKGCKKSGRCCSLLIGAGCSVSAGIPLASGFVKEIKKRYPAAYKRASDKTYPACMAELESGIRRDLIVPFIDDAKINWAHLAIAQLITNGFVDRVLTTNFDPLVSRACALANEFPAVYDLAASHHFQPEHVGDQAIFHLHGQRDGFVLLNTEAEVRKHVRRLGTIFAYAGQGHAWIVVGYSGENDPVFDLLAKEKRFDYGLYWVGYNERCPSHVEEKLIDQRDGAYFLGGYDADDFFVELADELGVFPPSFIGKPYEHLRDLLGQLVDYRVPGQSGRFDATALVRKHIDKTIERHAPALSAEYHLLAGDYSLAEKAAQARKDKTAEERDLLYWARVMQGLEMDEQALLREGEDRQKCLSKACIHFERALEPNPDGYDAYNNWGIALSRLATGNGGRTEDKLWRQAYAKYKKAIAIKPDGYEALYNWGLALSDQAKSKSGAVADKLRSQACAKYESAISINPELHEAFYSWGRALTRQAMGKSEAASEKLRREACAKYKQSVAIKPDKHEALYNWAHTLSRRAATKSGAAAGKLWRDAYDRYKMAVAVKPDSYDAFYHWGLDLSRHAIGKRGAVADKMNREACNKYKQAVAIKPDHHDALYCWGLALNILAIRKSGIAADKLQREACDKYKQAVRIEPKKHKAFHNWGKTLIYLGRGKSEAVADKLRREACDKFKQAVAIKPDTPETLDNWGSALIDIARGKKGAKRTRLLVQASELTEKAERIQSGLGAYNLACISALLGEVDKCRRWLEKAKKAKTLPDKSHIAEDEDLVSVRDKVWFGKILQSAPN